MSNNINNTSIDTLINWIKLDRSCDVLAFVKENEAELNKNYFMVSFNIQSALNSGKETGKIASAVKRILTAVYNNASEDELISACRFADVLLNY